MSKRLKKKFNKIRLMKRHHKKLKKKLKKKMNLKNQFKPKRSRKLIKILDLFYEDLFL